MPLTQCYSILKGQIDHCQEEYEKSKQEQPSSIQSRIDVLKKIQNRDILKAIESKQLLLLSDTNPDVGFTVAKAMNRNKYIYAFSKFRPVERHTVCAQKV